MNSLDLDEWQIWKLLSIMVELDMNSMMDIESYQLAIDEIYEEFEGYRGYAEDIDEFVFDEDGEIITHSKEEYNDFVYDISRKILKTLIEKSKIGKEIYRKGFEEGEYYTTIFYTEKDDDYNY